MLGRADSNFSLSGLETAVSQEAEGSAPQSVQDNYDTGAGYQTAALEARADRLPELTRVVTERLGGQTAL